MAMNSLCYSTKMATRLSMSASLASTMDLFTTALVLAGAEVPTDRAIDGVDLLHAGRDSLLTDRPLFWRSDFNRAVRFQQWKLLHNKQTGSLHLFDLSRDIGERQNIAQQHPDVVARLMKLINEWESELKPAKWPRVMDYFSDGDGEGLWFAI